MDSFARFCLGWGTFVGSPLVLLAGAVPGCFQTSEFALMVSTTGAMLLFGITRFLLSWKRAEAGFCIRGFTEHSRGFFSNPEKPTHFNHQIDNQEQEVVQ